VMCLTGGRFRNHPESGQQLVSCVIYRHRFN
jgi:hypothetical protein